MSQKIFKTKKGTELPVLNLKGKDYLEVKYRLVWFREERPTWSIQTEPVSLTDKMACFKATVSDEMGRIISTSHKIENIQGFPDFAEKAETGSIGRALALLGYGTQFCADELDEGDRIVDSPVLMAKTPTGTRMSGSVAPEQPSADDGIQTFGRYMVGGGKWVKRSLPEIMRAYGPEDIANYIAFLEESAIKRGSSLNGWAKDFVEQAELYMAAYENQKLDPKTGEYLSDGGEA